MKRDPYVLSRMPLLWELIIPLNKRGITVDKRKRDQLRKERDSKLQSWRRRATKTFKAEGFELPLGKKGAPSSKKVQEILYDSLNLPTRFDPKTGKPTAARRALQTLRPHDASGIVELLLEYSDLKEAAVPLSRSFLVHLAKAAMVARGKRRDPMPRVIVNPDPAEVRKSLAKWSSFAFDTETPTVIDTRILSLAISGERMLAYVWAFETGIPRANVAPVIEAFKSDRLVKVAQNGEFDIPRLEKNGFKITKVAPDGSPLIWDTMIDAQILHPDEPANLSFLVSMALDVEAWKHERKRGLYHYNGLDANYTWRIYEANGRLAVER